MTASERLDSKGGPMGNLSQAYFANLDRIAKAYEPALRGVGRWNLELINLMTRRAQAWMEVPVQLSRCKTPRDVVGVQLKFWQQANSHYAEGSQRLGAALGSCAVMPGLNGAWRSKPAPARDYITFAEPAEAEPAPAERRDRRAA